MRDTTKGKVDALKAMKAQIQSPAKNVATWTFLIAATAACTLHLVLPHIGEKGIPFPKPGHLVVYSILGLALLNILAFTTSLFSALQETAEITQDDSSEQDKEERAERVLAPALRGDRPPPPKAYYVARFCFWVLIGLIVGSLIAYVVQFNIEKFSS
ncbi:MAG: hypothetical protein ACYS8I_01050 [Planctomycetota bacterium]|jgi:hypothetical protein